MPPLMTPTTWEWVATRLPLLNTAELSRRSGVPRGRIHDAKRGRQRLSQADLDKLRPIITQLGQERIADALTTPITWIPVAEQLPDDDITVLVAGLEVELGYHSDGEWISPIGDGALLDTPTHWADLPEHPDA